MFDSILTKQKTTIMNITISTSTGEMIEDTSKPLNNETITDVIASMTTPAQFETLIESGTEWSSNYTELIYQIQAALKSLQIKAAFAAFVPSSDGAYATGRLLNGQYAQENQQEWVEIGSINGTPVKIVYIFENSEVEVEDTDNIPFDAAHVSNIEIED